MAKFVIHAGDMNKGEGMVRTIPKPLLSKKPYGRQFILPNSKGKLGIMHKNEDLLWPHDFAEIEIASEEAVIRMGGTIGWGAAGAALLGPVGLLAGLLLGGKKDEVTFVAKLNDGRKLMGVMEKKDYSVVLQSAMSRGFNPGKEEKKITVQPVDVADQIKKLAELRDQGILTEEEFSNQKTKLLNS
jgi:hypothetical protein